MKKNSFVEGAMISTIGIIICKIIGLLYVIPFRSLIGASGAVLYSYAYNIYVTFAALSSTGIPSAMSKTISEYNSLEYYNAQERAYKICKYILVGIGFVSFIIMFILAPQFAKTIKGGVEGGNTIEDITFVIRVISTALLIIPLLSVSKGYVQGHRMMTVPSISNVIEQLVRVIVIIFGSYFVLNVLHLSITTAVGVAVFGATAGALIAYLYIIKKISNNKAELKVDEQPKKEEKAISNKEIAKKIIVYALPFVLIEFIRSLFNSVDTFTLVKPLVSMGYDVNLVENILSILNTWGSKLHQIILALTYGLTISIIPNIVRSATLNNYEDVSLKINQTLKIIFFIALPLTIGVSFLSADVWTIFYGYDSLSVEVFKYYILGAFINSFFFILINIINALNKPLVATLVLVGSLILKAVFNIPIMYLCKYYGIDAYYGSIITTIVVQTLAAIYTLYYLHKSFGVNYKKSLPTFIKIILMNVVMMVVLYLLQLVLPELPHTRLYSILDASIYGIVGMGIYLFIAVKLNILNDVFGQDFINKIFGRFKRAR